MDVATRVETSGRRWSLRLGERLAGGFRSEVYAAVRPDGTDAVLKLCATLAEAHAEVAALQAWTGSGASVALLDSDDELGALLLVRLWPGTAMPRGEVATVEAAAAMLSVLHARHPDGFAFRDVAGSFPSHERRVRDDLAYERRTRARNETTASCAVVIDIGWKGMSRVGLDMEYLARRPSPRPGRARRRHDEALEVPTLTGPSAVAACVTSGRVPVVDPNADEDRLLSPSPPRWLNGLRHCVGSHQTMRRATVHDRHGAAFQLPGARRLPPCEPRGSRDQPVTVANQFRKGCHCHASHKT